MVRKSAILLALPVLLVAAACGGGDDDNGAATGGSPAASTSAQPNNSALGPLQAEVAQLTTRPTKILDRPAFSKPFPKDKTIAVVVPSTPAGYVRGTEMVDVGKVTGWNVRILNAGSGADLAKITNAVQQAVELKPDAVVISGFPSAIFQPQLKALQAAKIPVFSEYTTDLADEPNGFYSLYGTSAGDAESVAMAKYVLATLNLEPSTHTLFVNTPSYPIVDADQKAFSASYKQLCASCELSVLNIPAASIGVDVPSRVVGFLQSHSDVDAIVYGFSDLATGVPAALKAANITSIKASTAISTSPATLTYLRNGQIGSLTSAPPEWTWYVADVMARLFVGLPLETAQIDPPPIWLITKDGLPADADLSQPNLVAVADYVNQFKQLWGL